MVPTRWLVAVVLALVPMVSACSSSDGGGAQPAGTSTSVVTPSTSEDVTAAPATTAPTRVTTSTLPDWSDDVTRPFLAECSLVVDASSCRCVLDAARASVSEERFVSWASELVRSGAVEPELAQLVDDCGGSR